MTVIRCMLAIFFSWSIFQYGSLIFRSSATDRVLYATADMGWLFWMLLISSLAGLVVALGYTFNPRYISVWLALVGLLPGFLFTAIGSILGMQNPEIAKEAYVSSRQARGLSVRPELLELMDNPIAHIFPLVFACMTLAVCVVLMVVLHRLARGKAFQPVDSQWITGA